MRLLTNKSLYVSRPLPLPLRAPGRLRVHWRTSEILQARMNGPKPGEWPLRINRVYAVVAAQFTESHRWWGSFDWRVWSVAYPAFGWTKRWRRL